MSESAGPANKKRLGQVAAFVVAAVSIAAVVASSALVLAKHEAPAAHGPDLHALPSQTRQAYEIASTHQDLFAHMPCYCGCAVLAVPHRNLVDCFFESSGAYGNHAASCSTCVDIALAAAEAEQQGLDHAQIRALIDAQFSARGPGTATAYP